MDSCNAGAWILEMQVLLFPSTNRLSNYVSFICNISLQYSCFDSCHSSSPACWIKGRRQVDM
jgi:hypothetical protein